MSTDCVHVGPIVECTMITTTKTTEYLTCSNTMCTIAGKKVKFGATCNHCGYQLVTRTKSHSLPSVNANEIDRVISCSFREISTSISNKKDKHYWISYGISEQTDLGYNIDPVWDRFLISYQPEELTLSLERFKTTFSKELDIFNKIYGSDNVKVRWAVCNSSYKD